MHVGWDFEVKRVNSRLAYFFLQVFGVFVDSCTTDSESWSD